MKAFDVAYHTMEPQKKGDHMVGGDEGTQDPAYPEQKEDIHNIIVDGKKEEEKEEDPKQEQIVLLDPESKGEEKVGDDSNDGAIIEEEEVFSILTFELTGDQVTYLP